MRLRFSHTRTRTSAPHVRVRVGGLLRLIVIVTVLLSLGAPTTLGANFSANQNADMLIGGSAYGERSFDADRSTAGTVALWHFDAATGRDTDSSGNGHTLTPRNSPSVVDGPSSGFHKAASLDGTSQDFNAASSPAFNLTTNFTIEAWFRTSDIGNTANPAMVSRQNPADLHTNYELWFDRGSNELNFSLTSSGGWHHATIGAGPYVNGAWHHVAGVYDGSFLRLYVDGVQVDTTAFSGSADTPARPITIGNDISDPGPEWFHGDIDEVRLSNVARSAASIAATWTTGLPFHTNFAEYGMNNPSDVAVDASGSVYVVDSKLHRLLRWGTTPTRDGEPFEHVLYKPTVANGSTPDIRWSWSTTGLATSMNQPSNVAVAGSGATLKLALGDGFDNRVILLQKDEATLANGDFGTLVLGQPNLTSNTSGDFTAGGLDTPMGMWTDGTRLAVTDRVLHRVLLWDTWPTANNQPADHVLGQGGYGASNVCPNRSWNGTACNGINSAASDAAIGAATLESPHDVHFDGTFLYVADSDNNRLLVWSGWPSSDGPAADWVLGQANMTSAVNSHGITGLYRPSSVDTTGTGPTHKLAVAGRQGSRVLIWDAWPSLAPGSRTNAPSSAVLGQSAHGLGTANRGTDGTGRAAANSLAKPAGLAFDPSGSLWISDLVNNRVVRYDSAALSTGSSANRVLGHRSMTSSTTLDAAGGNVFPNFTLGSYTIWGARLGLAPSGRLIETNYEESAVRIWNAPSTNGAFDVRLGQPTRADAGPNSPDAQVDASSFGRAGQVWTDGTRTLIADQGNHRVLAWTTASAADGDPADFVLGQAAMTTQVAGAGLAQMDRPLGVTSDGTDVFVADADNNRILVFRNFWAAPSNGRTADLQLGSTAGASTTQLDAPFSLALQHDQLIAADRDNNRIVVWNDVDLLTSGEPIDAVVGQTNATNRGLGTVTSEVTEVSAAGGAVFWASNTGTRVLDPIPRSGFVTAAGIQVLGTNGAGYQPAPTQAIQAYPSSVAALGGTAWVASSMYGRLMRWTDAIAPTITTAPTATVRCNGTVDVSWVLSESATMEVRYDTVSRGSWAGGYASTTTDLYKAAPRYAGLTHVTALSIPNAGTYYARVQGIDWAGQSVTSGEISLVIPPTCPSPTTLLGDDANAQSGTGRANPSTTNAPPLRLNSFHTSWQNVAGATMDRYQNQSWTTPPEHAGGVWHMNNTGAADPLGATTDPIAWSGAPGYVADGKFGDAIRLDGASHYGTVPDSANVEQASGFTVETWFRTSDLSAGTKVLVHKGGCGTDCTYSIELRTGPARINAVSFAGGVQKNASAPLDLRDGAWHHAAMTVAPNTPYDMHLYVDGQQAAGPTALNAPATLNAVPMYLGSSAGTGLFFNGDLDEMRFSPIAYDAAAIAGFYRTGRPHLQLVHDTGAAATLGADCVTATRCADFIYGTVLPGSPDVMRDGARYWQRARLNTKANDYWSTWGLDWVEVEAPKSLTISTGATVNLGTTIVGQDAFGTSTIQVSTNDALGYRLFASDGHATNGMVGVPAGAVPDMQAATLPPTTWTAGAPLGIGYTVRTATGTRLAKWGPAGAYAEDNVVDNLYTGFGTTDVLLHQRLGYSTGTDTITLTTRASIPSAIPPGTYSSTVVLTALANP